ncbi:MAG: M28 family peptidase [Aquificaceae bacterium]|nr:M28 family peptidase [Aquificaceae bacterium]MCX8163908.1 M28 family peptidase [Aquificaceae bacterium]
MKSDRLEFFKEFAYKVLSYNRLASTDGHRKAHRLIEYFLEHTSCNYTKESFVVNRFIPKEAWLKVKEEKIKAVAYLGTKRVEKKAYIKRDYMEGDIALLPDVTKSKALEAQEKGAVAIVTYREKFKLKGYVYGDYMGVDIPILCVDREDVEKIEDFNVELFVNSSERSIYCTNFLMELGRGPVLYLVANMDTVHEIYGAIKGGVGFLMLLFLYEDLKDTYNAPYRLRFLITDGRELGLEGARFHLSKNPKHVFYCINLEGIGWHNPCVVYEDAGGYSGDRINELFYKHLEDLKVSLDFCKAKERDGDHIPFKERGVQALYLSSYPLHIEHTIYDNYDAISWDHVVMWYEVLTSFLRRFHKL